MIVFQQKGDLQKTMSFLQKTTSTTRSNVLNVFNAYGKKGVDALSSATPSNTGLTAQSWHYKIINEKDSISIYFYNTNVDEKMNVPIAVIIQYGHGTGTGGWVQGRDYINPAIRPVFDELVNALWGEVVNT